MEVRIAVLHKYQTYLSPSPTVLIIVVPSSIPDTCTRLIYYCSSESKWTTVIIPLLEAEDILSDIGLDVSPGSTDTYYDCICSQSVGVLSADNYFRSPNSFRFFGSGKGTQRVVRLSNYNPDSVGIASRWRARRLCSPI